MVTSSSKDTRGTGTSQLQCEAGWCGSVAVACEWGESNSLRHLGRGMSEVKGASLWGPLHLRGYP